ncbi:MAG TPA: membrane protein insertion efficiency factor YidD [Burkholderiales bacterium]|nr:membrane protein insertion efficiency factor YidD [Burkholderiales bacterium]
MGRAALTIIALYRFILSPLLGNNCRFAPSCSEYTRDAIVKFGFLKGSWIGLKRILRCHPWNAGGYDPLP